VVTFDVRPGELEYEYLEDDKNKVIYFRCNVKKVLAGYIKYKYDGEKESGNGILTMVNFKARLQLKRLNMGGTTKGDNPRQADKHGEGMDIAILVMRRGPNNYSVRFLSNSTYWNAHFDERKNLFVKLTRPKERTLAEQRARFYDRGRQGLPRSLEPNIWEDVCVEIGSERKRKDELGWPSTSRKIPVQKFRAWLKFALDVNPPRRMIKTTAGDLILEPSHAGNLYLKGLLLPDSASSGNAYQMGYNLHKGQTNRDRGRLTNAKQEAEQIAWIWSAALGQNSSVVEQDKCWTSIFPSFKTVAVLLRMFTLPDITLLKKWRRSSGND